MRNDDEEWVEGGALERWIAHKLEYFGSRKKVDPTQIRGDRERLSDEDRERMRTPPTWEEFKAIINNAKRGKATAVGDLNIFFLKNANVDTQRFFWRLTQRLWLHPEEISRELASAAVRLIHKAGKNDQKIEGWRPIVIGTMMAKVLMSIWTRRLTTMANKHEWIHTKQFGFVKGKSTKGVADCILRELEAKGKGACILQWDIERAFPSISMTKVLELLSLLGVEDSFGNVAKTIYDKGEQHVHVAGQKGGKGGEAKFQMTWGLKQGCAASPILMNIWIYHMIAKAATELEIFNYADDIWVVADGTHIDRAKMAIPTLADEVGLTINAEKVDVWNAESTKPLKVLGMLIKESRKGQVEKELTMVAVTSILRGMERKLGPWQRVVYVNTVVIPRIRYKVWCFWHKSVFATLQEIDKTLRKYVRLAWKPWVDNNFFYDTGFGLGLRKVEIEVAKDWKDICGI